MIFILGIDDKSKSNDVLSQEAQYVWSQCGPFFLMCYNTVISSAISFWGSLFGWECFKTPSREGGRVDRVIQRASLIVGRQTVSVLHRGNVLHKAGQILQDPS